MRGQDLIMWSEGQWEASKKIAWGGDKQTHNSGTDFATTRKNRPKGWFFDKSINVCLGVKSNLNFKLRTAKVTVLKNWFALNYPNHCDWVGAVIIWKYCNWIIKPIRQLAGFGYILIPQLGRRSKRKKNVLWVKFNMSFTYEKTSTFPHFLYLFYSFWFSR